MEQADVRTPLLIANWKMNKLRCQVAPYFADLSTSVVAGAGAKVDVGFAVPFTALDQVSACARPKGYLTIAQTCHFEAHGAFTGEVALPMLREVGVDMVLIGHSERRQFFGESDVSVAQKVRAALEVGIIPVVCVGESLAERESEETAAVVSRQLEGVFASIKELSGLVVAYEPVWAIGTGRSATNHQAQEVHHLIRSIASRRFGQTAASQMRILYGGSVNPTNIGSLLDQPDIDGGLVGGASLNAADFGKMANIAATLRA